MNKSIKILSVNISDKKGVIKHPVDKIILNEMGIINDAHSGKWHRQVSMLGKESFDKFSVDAGRTIQFGEFAENITTEGLELFKCKPLDIFRNQNVELMVTQIGKNCHGDKCAIYTEVGNCVMPKEGIFCKVIKNGELAEGNELTYFPKIFKVLVVTLSERASLGEYADRSGPRIINLLNDFFKSINRASEINYQLIPDDEEMLKNIVLKATNELYDIIITTGGTGISRSDITIETIKPLLDKEIPGIMDKIRLKYGEKNPFALISRSIAGVRSKTLIFSLPGSVKAVEEYMTEIQPLSEHLILMLNNIDSH